MYINIAMKCSESDMACTTVLFMRMLWQATISCYYLFHGWPCLYAYNVPLFTWCGHKYSMTMVEIKTDFHSRAAVSVKSTGNNGVGVGLRTLSSLAFSNNNGDRYEPNLAKCMQWQALSPASMGFFINMVLSCSCVECLGFHCVQYLLSPIVLHTFKRTFAHLLCVTGWFLFGLVQFVWFFFIIMEKLKFRGFMDPPTPAKSHRLKIPLSWNFGFSFLNKIWPSIGFLMWSPVTSRLLCYGCVSF